MASNSNIAKTIAGIFLVAMISACETILTIDIPEEPRKPVINAIFKTDSTFTVNVSWSKHVLNENPTTFIENATVTIFDENEQMIEVLEYDNRGYYRSSTHYPKQNTTYRTRVEIPGYATIIEGNTTIPFAPRILNATNQIIDLNGTQEQRYSLTFEDDPTVQNFYEVSVQTMNENNEGKIEYQTQKIDVEDRAVAVANPEGRESLLFKDDLFHSEQITLNLKAPNAFSVGLNSKGTRFILKCVTKEYYDYKVTFELQRKLSADPLAQPVSVKTNIENGLGLISSYAAASFIYILPDPKIISISPSQGRIGDAVTITGENLHSETSSTRVLFFTRPEPIFSSSGEGVVVAESIHKDPKSVTVIIPVGAVTNYIVIQSYGKFAMSKELFEILN